MPELKLGTKFECYNCGTKFYDLGKTEAVCPKCGANQKDSVQAEAPAASQASRRKRKVEIKPIETVDEEETVDVAPDEDLDTPDLEEGDLDEEEQEDLDDDE